MDPVNPLQAHTHTYTHTPAWSSIRVKEHLQSPLPSPVTQNKIKHWVMCYRGTVTHCCLQTTKSSRTGRQMHQQTDRQSGAKEKLHPPWHNVRRTGLSSHTPCLQRDNCHIQLSDTNNLEICTWSQDKSVYLEPQTCTM